MILDKNYLLEHVTVGVPEPEQKTKHKKNEKKAKRIVLDSGSLDPSYIRTIDSKANV